MPKTDQDSIKGVCNRFREVVFDISRDDKHTEQEWKKKKNYIWTNDRSKTISGPFFLSMVFQDPGYLGLAGVLISSLGTLIMFAAYLFREYSDLWDKSNLICKLFDSVFAFNEIHDNSFVILGVIIIIGLLFMALVLFGMHSLQVRIQCYQSQIGLFKRKTYLIIPYFGYLLLFFLAAIIFQIKKFEVLSLLKLYLPFLLVYSWWIWLPCRTEAKGKDESGASHIFYLEFSFLGFLLGYLSSNAMIKNYLEVAKSLVELLHLYIMLIIIYIGMIFPGASIFLMSDSQTTLEALLPKPFTKVYLWLNRKTKKDGIRGGCSDEKSSNDTPPKDDNSIEKTCLEWLKSDLKRLGKIAVKSTVFIGGMTIAIILYIHFLRG